VAAYIKTYLIIKILYLTHRLSFDTKEHSHQPGLHQSPGAARDQGEHGRQKAILGFLFALMTSLRRNLWQGVFPYALMNPAYPCLPHD
jgi:hypothetical protein